MKNFWLLGSLALVTGTANAAVSAYQTAIENARKSVEAKDYSAARKSFEAAQAAATTSDEKIKALFNVGVTHQEEGNHAKAREIWGQVLLSKNAADDEKLDAQLGIAASYLAEKRFAESRAEFAKALTSPAANAGVLAMARLTIAGSYSNEGKPDLARVEFAKIAADSTVEPAVRFLAQQEVGEIAFRANNFADARAEFTKAFHMEGINILVRTGSMTRIIETYKREGSDKQAGALTSQTLSTLTKQGKSLISDKRFAEARLCYQSALIIGPGQYDRAVNATLHLKIAETYLGEKKFEEARKEIQGVLDLTDVEVGLRKLQQFAQLNLASSYSLEGNKERAQQEYEKALQLPELLTEFRSMAEKGIAELETTKQK